MLSKVHSFSYDHVILGGDFNTVLDNSIDRSQGFHANKKSSKYLREAIEVMELIDAWREFYPDRFGYTWCRNAPNYMKDWTGF